MLQNERTKKIQYRLCIVMIVVLVCETRPVFAQENRRNTGVFKWMIYRSCCRIGYAKNDRTEELHILPDAFSFSGTIYGGY